MMSSLADLLEKFVVLIVGIIIIYVMAITLNAIFSLTINFGSIIVGLFLVLSAIILIREVSK